MSAKERFKALAFTASLLTVGHVGNFFPLLVDEAGAHGGQIQQWTVEEFRPQLFVKSKDAGWSWKNCPHQCGDKRRTNQYDRTYADFMVTVCYLDDGHEVYWQDGEARELPGTRTVKPINFYYQHYKTNSLDCHNGN